jgi:2',3'-cyclic-nucleotide 2'-phosphodiesterase (5'-nucleotidase family)
VRILHTNDLHGKLTPGRCAALEAVRSDYSLYFDSGDTIQVGNLAVPLKPDPAWPMLQGLNVTATVPGNRETHVLAAAIERKFEGATHPVVCANWFSQKGDLRWPGSIILEQSDLRIGIFGVMVAMVTERMASRAASQYLWQPPIPTAIKVAQELRPEVDLVIALTHIGYAQDCQLAEQCPEIDIILGGHSHTVLDHPVKMNETYIAQTGSHGRFYGDYLWEKGALTGRLIPWIEK